jgi:hypothetical protein
MVHYAAMRDLAVPDLLSIFFRFSAYALKRLAQFSKRRHVRTSAMPPKSVAISTGSSTRYTTRGDRPAADVAHGRG